jgi:DNA topoisomerase IB
MTTAVQTRKRRAPTSVIPADGMSAVSDADPADVARRSSLRYVTDTDPGYSRHRRAAGFTYRDQHNLVIKDRKNIERIAKLAIPPAWSHVWIAQQPNGHIQATGRDAKGRKQYRYHARWQTVRSEHKFDRMIQFGISLPTIRARVMADLERNDLSREHVLAIVVRLLETTRIRIGNEEYARSNHSFGLTTLRNRHVHFSGETLRFQFIGKMGKAHSVCVANCLASPCFNIMAMTARPGVWTRVMSTTTSARSRASHFRQRTFGRGPGVCWLRHSCPRNATLTAHQRRD